jgi:hypothetical protein
VLDLTERDFQDIFNVTGRIFEIGVQRLGGSVSTVVCPNSDFLKQDLKGKHSWLNACSAKSCLNEFGTFSLPAVKIP